MTPYMRNGKRVHAFARRLLSEEIRKEVRGFPETDHAVLPKVKFHVFTSGRTKVTCFYS